MRYICASLLMLAVLLGCQGPQSAAPPPEPPAPAHLETFSAVVRVARASEEPAGKGFRGVDLERDDGQRWVASYEPHGFFRELDGHRVTVSGVRHEPPGGARGVQHFKVHEIRVAPETGAFVVRVGPEQQLRGYFEVREMPEGTKLAGEKILYFVSDGTSYIVGGEAPAAAPDETLTITARAIEMSPHVAHLGGPRLWVMPRPR